MSKFVPLEETIIMPSDYKGFSALFPNIFHNFTSRVNSKAEVEGKDVTLTTKPQPICSFLGTTERTALVFVIGSHSKLPSLVAIYATFGFADTRLFEVFSHVPDKQRIDLTSGSNTLMASVVDGQGNFKKGTFRTRIVYL